MSRVSVSRPHVSRVPRSVPFAAVALALGVLHFPAPCDAEGPRFDIPDDKGARNGLEISGPEVPAVRNPSTAAVNLACEAEEKHRVRVTCNGVRIARIAVADGGTLEVSGGKDALTVRVRGRVADGAFNLCGRVADSVTNHLLRVNASLYVPDPSRGFRNDETVNLCGKRWDFRLWKQIGPKPLDVCVVPDMPVGGLRRVAELRGWKVALSVATTERCVSLVCADGFKSLEILPTDAGAPAPVVPVTEFRFGSRHALAFGAPFTDGAILQREMPVPVWGRADPGADVAVSFAGQRVTGRADAKGVWRVTLAPMAASKEGCELVAEAGGWRIAVADVRVGEVWLASGQSNMELPLCGKRPLFRDGQGRLIAAMTRRNENVRFAHAAVYITSPEPMDDINLTWAPLCPEYLAGHLYVSALATLFERELFDALDVPIGVIGGYWGGTLIEPWTPDGPWAKLPKAKNPYPQQTSHRLFNAHFAPLAPYAVRGLLWYQGETNVSKAEEYTARMHEFYGGFSRAFENPSFKMIFAQLAPFGGKSRLAELQDAQTRFADEEPNAWMAVIADVGNPFDIHPNDKRTVARRFAALALRHCYGWNSLAADSPRVVSASVTGRRVTLTVKDGGALYSYAPDHAPVKGFELRDAAETWFPAKVVNEDGEHLLRDGVIELESADVAEPKAVRYLRTPPYVGTLYSGGDLPLGTFQREL